jgi:PKD repeat protein
VLAYSWAFGDGSSGTGSTSTHVYTAAGSYSVKLTVSDGDGGSGTATTSVTIESATSYAEDARDEASAAPTSSYKSSSDKTKVVDGFDEIADHIAAGETKDALKDIKTLETTVKNKVTDSTLKASLLDSLKRLKTALGG